MNKNLLYRSIPKVDILLADEGIKVLIETYSRESVMEAIHSEMEKLRAFIGVCEEEEKAKQQIALLNENIAKAVSAMHTPNMKKVINGTGTILHTNLGRAPISFEHMMRAAEIVSGYSNLEYNLEAGRRGERYSHFEKLLCKLTGAEAAMAVNNNASSVLLILSSLAKGGEVIVSRGELIEIGGKFRIPDVMEQSGANLVEVGTTNKTHYEDYEEAITEETKALLKVHTSNYRIVGFTESVGIDELVPIAKEHGIPVVEDLGSGVLINLEKYGLTHEPTVQESIAHGADVVCFSGDKLLGGPQAGIIIGKTRPIHFKGVCTVDAGAKQVVEIEVPESWKSCEDEGLFTPEVKGGKDDVVAFVKNIQSKVNAQEGNTLPVSTFTDYADGSTPSGSAAYEKRGIAVDIPVWQSENCIQCNRCAYVCPHAVIRPVALTEDELAKAPEGTKAIDMIGMPGMKFTMTVSAYDCTGCGSCVNVCPGKKGEKALVMANMEENAAEQDIFDFGREIEVKPEVVAKFKPETVKGSQFKQPLLEFSGACAGCGETPYAKLITQLFGDRMYIANATGCSSIWGNSSPSTPYTMNSKGQGPAWSNSLFEDNAEFGYGMLLAQKAIRKRLKEEVETVAASEQASAEVKAACQEYLDTFACGITNGDATDKLVAALDGCDCDTCKDIVKNKDFLAKKSQWIFGGDGWAYDIGFGGVDHVLASGEDINIMVFDTEVYSNTGGQSSKATKTGATAQFAAGGKETKKKDLASMAMSYGYVYVAQIAMGGDFNQTVKAIAEAEAYPGPSLIIAYAPCINHGIKKGMSKAQTEEQLAVECGYWNNFRFNPAAEKGSKFTLDSKQPKEEDYQAFLDGEVRYNALKRANPEKAARLFAKNEAEAMERYDYLSKLTDLYKVEE